MNLSKVHWSFLSISHINDTQRFETDLMSSILRVDLYQNENEKISFNASDIRITKWLLTIGNIHIDDR